MNDDLWELADAERKERQLQAAINRNNYLETHVVVGDELEHPIYGIQTVEAINEHTWKISGRYYQSLVSFKAGMIKADIKKLKVGDKIRQMGVTYTVTGIRLDYKPNAMTVNKEGNRFSFPDQFDLVHCHIWPENSI